MNKTPFHKYHLAAGARIVEFAGYEMPITYTGIQQEHTNVRTKAGVFDVSHMGEFIVSGKEALDLIQKVTTNDASKLKPGRVQYSCLPNDKGGIVDDLLVYRLADDENDQVRYMLVVNASNIEKDLLWIRSNNEFEARVENISENIALLAVQGPMAAELMQPFCTEDLKEISYYHFVKSSFAGVNDVIISATGYTGSGGFEIYIPVGQGTDIIWEALASAGIEPTGLGARDSLRLEMGFCLYGNDIDENTSPIEAGLGWITKFKKGPFISRDIFLKHKKEGTEFKLAGFIAEGKRVPRQGHEIHNEKGENIGRVTSGTFSPSLQIPIGMGYIRTDLAVEGNQISVFTGKKSISAEVVKVPFYTKDELV
jgi:aminomethyltransferase